MKLKENTIYTIPVNNKKYYLEIFFKGAIPLFRIMQGGALVKGGFCTVGIDLFYWEKGIEVIPTVIKTNEVVVGINGK